MEEINKSKFEEKYFFCGVNLKSYLGVCSKENEKVVLCGKMNEHSILNSRQSFKACDFLIYLPSVGKLFHSEMESLDCFTGSLKWNLNFFKKVRLCLETPEGVKNTNFSINYEQKEEKGGIILDSLDNSVLKSEPQEQIEISDEIEFTERKMYLELHFIVETQDIIAFRLKLNHLLQDNPQLLLMNKFLEFEKIENDKLMKKQQKSYEYDMDISRMEKEINKANENLEKKKKQYLFKFYYLNKEKNKKINELTAAIKKEKKLLV
jgi:hypothetical protein